MVNNKILLPASLAIFAASAMSALLTIDKAESLQVILQVLAVTALLIILVTRFIFPKFAAKSPAVAYFVQFVPIALFVYLLVFSTGGLASPFLALTHLFAIGMGFLISPAVSMIYVAVTVAFVIAGIYLDPTATGALFESPFAVFLYILAYGAILPFTQYVAGIYQQKVRSAEELAQLLEAIKNQEQSLLKNMDEAVIALTVDLEITYANEAANKFLGYSPKEMLGKKFQELFKLRDRGGNDLTLEKINLSEGAVQILDKSGNFKNVNLKILPISQAHKIAGIMILISEVKQAAPVVASLPALSS